MKKGVMLVLLLFVGAFVIGIGSANSALNDSDLNGYYEIHNCTELQNMSLNLSANYELTNDIDCSDTVNWNGGAGFMPIGNSTSPFRGILAGKDNSVDNLFINRSNEDYIALFSHIESAAVKNISFNNPIIIGNEHVSVVVATPAGVSYIERTSIINMSLQGSRWVGGIFAYGVVTLSNSYTTGIIVSSGAAGGLASSNYGGVINSSYSSANVSGSIAGGLSGDNDGTVSNSFFVGKVTGANTGAIVANNYGSALSNVYWNNNSDNQNQCYVGGNTGCTSIDNNESYFYSFVNPPMDGWNFVNIWQTADNSFPVFVWEQSDYTSPNVNLFPQLNSTATSRTFIYNVSDDSAIANCSLILSHDSSNNTNLTAINISENNTITYPQSGETLPASDYTAYINCTDAYGFVGQSNTISFTVAAVSTGTTSGSSGGSSGSVVRTIAGSTIANGFTSNYRGGDSIKFDVKNQTHTLKVNSLTNGVATVTIQSEPQVITLSEGDIKDVDLENDGVYDLQVSFVKYYTTGIASIKVQQIEKAYSLPVEDNVNNDTLVDDIVDVFDGDETTESSNLALILSILLVVLFIGAIVGYVVWYLVRRRRFEIVANS